MYGLFDTTEYQLSHGRQPRGYANWALVPADYDYRDDPPADGIFWHYGFYADAKKEADRAYPYVLRWKVLP